jgi:3-oxoacyl-[acyl-carrier-protein] synthase-1
LSPLALLSQVATGYEEGHLYSDKPYRGDGLAGTFEKFFQETGIKDPVKEVYSSMNGENHWAKEWGVAHIRNQAFFDAEHGMHHPADCFGDTGAASGILLISLAAIGLIEGYRGSPSLVTCSSDFGDRSAVAVLSL